MQYQVEVYVEREWCGNGLVFPTKTEAEDYAKALWRAWFLVRNTRVLETDEKANYHFVGPTNHDIVEIKEGRTDG